MRLNIAHKIFGIALVVLVLMAAVAVYSVKLTAEISKELDLVAGKQLPLSDTIGQINVHTLEQGILLQRLFAMKEETPEAIANVKKLDERIEAEFARAYALFEAEEKTEHHPESILKLHEALKRVEQEYRRYEDGGIELLELHAAGDAASFSAKLPDFNALQTAVDTEISTLRKTVEGIAEDAVQRADENEKRLLIFNSVMTTISAVLGLGIAALVTFMLVRNVRNLVRAADEVGDGHLDVEVPVLTADEVGHLSSKFNDMVGDLRLKERIKDTFGKYMDPRIVTRLIDNPELTQLGGERQEMTVMFIDLQGYTTISEKLQPADLVRMLNMFLGEMSDAVSQNDGVINDFLGDAVMAYWGPPFTNTDEHATLACRAALDAFKNFDRYKAEVAAELSTEIEGLDIAMRVGISTGEVISGNIGSAASRKFSVIGDPVNLGARLEGVNKTYGTRGMIAERTRSIIGPEIPVREVDLIRVKGKFEPTRIYEVIPRGVTRASLTDALAAYRKQEWDTAERLLRAGAESEPDDPVPAVFLERVAILKANPPGPDWDGVWEFQTK
ncbi:MAG: HAMP domain-containing protein [Rhodospirillales bacterium]|nr:HAMP domain-containing protein [Rhodospirillales bacterium]MBO6788661.1 HAMP domain-containing protein [Rhodospirillales bacterium]